MMPGSKNEASRDMLDSIARRGQLDHVDLWPGIRARLAHRQSIAMSLRARPLLAVVLGILVILLLTGAAYAIGLLTGYIPGVGFVQKNSLRVLAQPVSETRDGITVTVEQVAADPERTVIIYKTEGMSLKAANSQGESGGPLGFGSREQLRLSSGVVFDQGAFGGYGGTPEPIINSVQTEGGWPNYVQRLIYPALDPKVNELTLLIPVLQNMPHGAAPENWMINFRLMPAPPGMTFAPMVQLTPQPSTAQGGTPVAGTPQPSSSSGSSSANGFHFALSNVIESQDGFVLTGDLSWDNSIFPTGKGVLGSDIPTGPESDFNPVLTDASGQAIPIEPVQVDAPYVEGHRPWSYRTDRKSFVGPLALTIPSIDTTFFAPQTDFEIDLGSSPQVGQTWQLNQEFPVEGHTIRLLSVSLQELSAPRTGDPCVSQQAELIFSFAADQPGMNATLNDLEPEPTPAGVCVSGGGGGGGGPLDPTTFMAGISYFHAPVGKHRFSMVLAIPNRITGPWQVTWQPPVTSAPTPTAAAQACLTQNTWKQALDRNDPLPAGLGGKLLTTVDEGGNLPAIYIQDLNGNVLRKFDQGAWPALSPDGTRFVYGGTDSLHLIELASGSDISFANDGYAHHWSPDNKRLLYTTTFALYVMNADGSGIRKIDTGSAQVLSVVGWLPDNQTIVYGSMGGAGFTFMTNNLQSGETRKLFSFQNKAGYGALSPDGQWIVFADRVFGATGYGIYISHLDGSERRMAVSPDVPSAFTANWGPDGQWLVVNTQAGTDQNLPLLLNPFTCQAVALHNIPAPIEGWSP